MQTNQVPRSVDIALPLRAAGVPVCVGGFLEDRRGRKALYTTNPFPPAEAAVAFSPTAATVPWSAPSSG